MNESFGRNEKSVRFKILHERNCFGFPSGKN